MLEVIINIICLIVILLAVILIYDARIITKRSYGFGDHKEGASGLKM